jgi:hypothetical protein
MPMRGVAGLTISIRFAVDHCVKPNPLLVSPSMYAKSNAKPGLQGRQRMRVYLLLGNQFPLYNSLPSPTSLSISSCGSE